MDINILDSLLYNFEYLFVGNMGSVKGLTVGLLQILILIDFVLAIVLNLNDGDHIKTYLQKILKYGIWIHIVQNWGLIINSIIKSFIIVGGTAGGSGIGLDLIKSPSTVCSEGLRFVYPLIEYLTQFKGMVAFFENPWIIFLTAISIIVILIAFIIIAIQVFITYVEFYITATLLLIFVPFGTNRYTSFIAEKAMGAIIGYGVKFMMLTAIMAAAGPIVRAWTVTATSTPTPAMLVGTMAACTLIAFLSWHVPGMAAGMMTGAPSLTAGNVASAGVAAGAAIVGAGMAATGAVGAIGSLSSAAAAGGGASATGGAVGSSALAHAASMPAGLPGGSIPQLGSSSSSVPFLSSGSSGGSPGSSASSSIPLLTSGQSSASSSSTFNGSGDSVNSAQTSFSSGQSVSHGGAPLQSSSVGSAPGTQSAASSAQYTSSASSAAHGSAPSAASSAGSAQYFSSASQSQYKANPASTSADTPNVTNTPQPQFSNPSTAYRSSAPSPSSSPLRSGMIASQAQKAIPDEAHPQGSFAFPIQDE